ncbi:hypothetical protein N9237_05455, partial [Akkermansiaceae bacterium]|nr:hypothetical protein [Akkermansiaceae bacterium]
LHHILTAVDPVADWLDPKFPEDALVVHAGGVKVKTDHLRSDNGGAKKHHNKSRQKRAACRF